MKLTLETRPRLKRWPKGLRRGWMNYHVIAGTMQTIKYNKSYVTKKIQTCPATVISFEIKMQFTFFSSSPEARMILCSPFYNALFSLSSKRMSSIFKK